MTTVGIPLNTGEQATDKMPQAKHVAGSRAAPTLHDSCFHMYVNSFWWATCASQGAAPTCQENGGVRPPDI